MEEHEQAEVPALKTAPHAEMLVQRALLTLCSMACADHDNIPTSSVNMTVWETNSGGAASVTCT